MAPKRSRIQTENRALIEEAALAVFSSEGYGGATIERIARAAGMSKPNLLYYFPTKEDIYKEVLISTMAGWLEPLKALNASGDPVTELSAYIRRKVEMSRAGSKASRLFANEIGRGAPLLRPLLETELKALVDEKSAVLQSWMDQGKLKPVDPHHLIFAIWAMTQHYADFEVQIGAILGPRASEPDFHDQACKAVLAIILNGVDPSSG